MTRIIAGTYGGRRITVPAKGTRPTTDRVREALFSRLDHADALRGARVLDLYAGSGALGLEALSRGAAHATFVESAPSALRVIQSNIQELGAGTRADAIKERVQPYLNRPATGTPFDLVFMDPPYEISRGEMTEALTALVPHLAPHAIVVVEWTTRAPTPDWPVGLTSAASKDYGETVLHFADHVG
ncbi:MAG: 16S rRNA (guanine(966)-N(2))-methyltransferase RsmD [Actinobacteria bacterium HGW-Actinobacteria-4]|nr:MAG: 16S rRNA (guanine(966)-N(2))-methyltransferase RsmD [Actinobacteria bacterium HGW-Actinobacteria-4]